MEMHTLSRVYEGDSKMDVVKALLKIRIPDGKIVLSQEM
jgi:hypothetical protein